MVQEYGVFSREEAAELRRLLHRVRAGVLNPVQRPPTFEFPQSDQVPVVYIARTPSSGIAGFDLVGGIPVLNYADCQIWRLLDDGTIEQVVNFTQRIWSFYDFTIPGNTWILVKHEAYGKWMAEWFDQGDDIDTDTGTGDTTGTGTGTASGCTSISYEITKVEYETAGTGDCLGTGTNELSKDLNEYTRTITLNIDSSGCLTKTESGWTFSRTLACNIKSCPCPEEEDPGYTGTGSVDITCCPNNLIPLLTVTVTNKTGGFVNVPDSFQVRYSVNDRWDIIGDTDWCNTADDFFFNCDGGSDCNGFIVNSTSLGISANPSDCSCDPFFATFDVEGACEAEPGTMTLTVTE